MKRNLFSLLIAFATLFLLSPQTYAENSIIIKCGDTLTYYSIDYPSMDPIEDLSIERLKDSPLRWPESVPVSEMEIKTYVGINEHNLRELLVPTDAWHLFYENENFIFTPHAYYMEPLIINELDQAENRISQLEGRENFMWILIIILMCAAGYYGQSHYDNKKRQKTN